MGGLVGLVNLRGGRPSERVLGRMADRVASRGPDGEGSFTEGSVAFAHRLRKVAPTPSQQPLVEPDAVLLLDGWIYDPAALARTAGEQAPPRTDTAAVLAAWRAFGPAFVEHLDGDFALALWDRTTRALYLARDRMGVRPLFWSRDGDRFAFASTLPALLEVPWVSRELARERIAEYLSFGVVHAPRTLLRDVHQVEPAHLLKLDAEGLRARRYWALRYAAPGSASPRESDVVDQLEEAVQRSVRRRVPRGGIATGLYLSGGLGSSVIGAASRRLFLDLPSFSIGFTDDPYPELPFAGRVARLLGLEHHQLSIGTRDLVDLVPELVGALGHPVAHPAGLLQLALSRAAAERVRVVLSGDGSDELLGGRLIDDLMRKVRVATAISKLPSPARRLLARAVGGTERGRAATTPPDRWAIELGHGGSRLFNREARAAIARDPELVRPDVRREVLQPFYADLHTDPINTVLYGWTRSSLIEDGLVRADRTAAAGGVDHRFPLLDLEVLTAAAALPGAVKVRRAGDALHTRWPLRAMLQGTLPPPLLHRPKRSLPTPLGQWLTGPGRIFLEARVARLVADPHRLWQPSAIRALVQQVDQSPAAGAQLWALIFLDLWLESLAPATP